MTPRSSPSIALRVVDVYPYRTLAGGRAEWLVLRRAPGRLYAGTWRTVGGKIETGETAWQAALRELHEETGHAPGPRDTPGDGAFWTVPSVNTFYEWTHDRINLVPAFAAELAADPVLCAEHDAFAWLPAEDAAARLAWPEPRRLLALAEATRRAGVPPELVVTARRDGSADGVLSGHR